MVDPRAGTITSLAEALECEEAWLLYGTSEKFVGPHDLPLNWSDVGRLCT